MYKNLIKKYKAQWDNKPQYSLQPPKTQFKRAVLKKQLQIKKNRTVQGKKTSYKHRGRKQEKVSSTRQPVYDIDEAVRKGIEKFVKSAQ